MKKLTLFTAILMTANMLFAQIIHIPADYPTIQQGVNAASDGDTVLVHPGTYHSNNYVNVNIQNKSITLASLYLITQDTSFVSQTVIDGGLDRVLTVIGSSNVRISGMTVTGGSCGMNCIGSNNVIIEQLAITGNSGGFVAAGAGVWISDCIDIQFNDVIISDNTSQDYDFFGSWGGGIYCQNSDPVFHNVTISNNTATSNYETYGGGISCFNSSPIFENCFFINNSAKFGGAVYCAHGSNPVFRNVVFEGNNCGEDWGMGSVLCLEDNWGPCFPSLINCTMTGNAGGVVYPYYIRLISCGWGNPCLSNVTVTNSISWYNEGDDYLEESTVSYSNVGGGQAGTGNINMEPLFLNTGEHPYQLSPGSPCIDAGTPDTTGLNLPLMDLLGNYRIWDGDGDGIERIDMGAYEFDAPIFVGIPQSEIANPKYEIQIFPNPFTTHPTIEFSLPKTSTVSIHIFNAMGAKVAELHHGQLPAGQQRFRWDAGDLPKGLYFCRVQAGKEIFTQKIIKVQ
ncbi:MAG: T9SS type A sorting domain-containing protein [Anaerolineaceae bacterium]|nr:T9SS type A sorting domain-containing protein [Anaerolineaceae bacterium]